MAKANGLSVKHSKYTNLDESEIIKDKLVQAEKFFEAAADFKQKVKDNLVIE
ncbi:hypothetical protein I5677_09740 [Mobilitalea sibirica]|uniref:Uncharacterized protein n=1 Tax=Mobilitalea sibirica TaxID=1462919 RepID=A0A8J7KX06_9FIRM|nr:hypothetical protein [Mobilitalea sibirica]MBH1941172.1 hypothetical protein [Mobilitalea sibirica]